ncbi:hypothetical protein CQW23_28219 [Capsicum baccatum]|uniref:Uncharacterized protein n=1 Tax=Capsicum baccatum TaxID=33114 RepID=A0A2G2VFX9_CAPBA|nr:hypothetical protein CQW23_28219 [Capsicum baccatum]
MANEDSPLFILGISQIETQKVVHDSNQIVGFTPGSFDYTKLDFSENRSKQWNDPEKLKILREALAAKNQVSHMQMEDRDEIEQIPKFPSRNITPPPQKLNHLDFPNPLMFGSTDAAANIAQAVVVQQQSEKTAPTEFRDEFDDFSTPPSVGLLKKMRLDTDSLIDHSKPRVSLDKDKVVPNIEMRDTDKAPTALEEKLSLSKSDLDEIKSYVRTYVDMKFNDLQKLMVDRYTGLLGVVKEGFDSFGKVAQYPVHESEKGNPIIEVDSPQSFNEHTTDAKSYNVVDAAGQSSKLGVNKGETEESLKENIKHACLESGNTLPVSVADDFSEQHVEALISALKRYMRAMGWTIDDIIGISPEVCMHKSHIEEECMPTSHNINRPYAEDLFLKFSVWMSAGLYNPHATKKGKDEYYTAKHANLKPTLDFVVAHPVKKVGFITWRNQVTVGMMRKKAKMDTISEYRYTTVNCIFMNYIHDTYTHYHQSHSEIDLSSHIENIRSMKVASVERSIYEIMQGLCISGGIPWNLIDEVYVPINYKAYAEFLSDRHQIPSSEFDSKKHRTRYASLLWDYCVNKACTGYVSDNQDSPRPKRTFIRSEDTDMIDVEP